MTDRMRNDREARAQRRPRGLRYEVHRSWSHTLDDRVYTALCAFPDTPRGQYDEEIDIIVHGGGRRRPNMAEVRRVAERELAEGYAEGLTVRRLVQAGI